jgi:hypothetical protein
MEGEMKRVFPKGKGPAGRRWVFGLSIPAALLAAGVLFAETEKTIVLEEATISARGERSSGGGEAAGGPIPKVPSAPGILPLLPTALPWEGEEEKGRSALSEEIFKVLTQPDPSYWPAEINDGIATRESK